MEQHSSWRQGAQSRLATRRCLGRPAAVARQSDCPRGAWRGRAGGWLADHPDHPNRWWTRQPTAGHAAAAALARQPAGPCGSATTATRAGLPGPKI